MKENKKKIQIIQVFTYFKNGGTNNCYKYRFSTKTNTIFESNLLCSKTPRYFFFWKMFAYRNKYNIIRQLFFFINMYFVWK